MHKIKIGKQVLRAEDGARLSDVLAAAGMHVEHPCGGRGSCRKCLVVVDGKQHLCCQYRVRSDISVSLPEGGDILSETGARETGKAKGQLCYALDIGTTTLALALVSLDEGKIVKVIARKNPQRTFGADVISRIDRCRRYGTDELQGAVVAEVNRMIAEMHAPSLSCLYVAGNATMLHLFFGANCSAMGVAPYTPTFIESIQVDAALLGLQGVDTAISLPSIAAFVGADIVAGLNLVGLPEQGKHDLLIDLGTNAEIVLFSRESALCTAAAAGPCFEGANISCGMSATDGAIYAYAPGHIQTVGNFPARGICGTGLVDVIAALLADGTVDGSGFMACEEFEIADGVTLEQADVRQYQLAKSAVYSAILTLMKIKGVSFEDIGSMYISGGFSAKINVASAVKTGLLPRELSDRCVPLYNSSLLGTVKFACEGNDLSAYVQNNKYVDLSTDPMFAALFIGHMAFDVGE